MAGLNEDGVTAALAAAAARAKDIEARGAAGENVRRKPPKKVKQPAKESSTLPPRANSSGIAMTPTSLLSSESVGASEAVDAKLVSFVRDESSLNSRIRATCTAWWAVWGLPAIFIFFNTVSRGLLAVFETQTSALFLDAENLSEEDPDSVEPTALFYLYLGIAGLFVCVNDFDAFG